jgi:hypothetical protein
MHFSSRLHEGPIEEITVVSDKDLWLDLLDVVKEEAKDGAFIGKIVDDEGALVLCNERGGETEPVSNTRCKKSRPSLNATTTLPSTNLYSGCIQSPARHRLQSPY